MPGDPLVNGSIGLPYRDPFHQGIGSLADLINAFAMHADRIGFTIPESSPIMAGRGMTLRDLTVGDLGRVLENISYGMGPMRGGNYATGGLGTLGGMKSDVFELANAAPGAALLGKGLAKGGKALAPTAAEMLRQRAEKYMRDSGSLKEIIAYHGTPHNWQPEPGFPDGRFRLDKMGTGEGAQAYGWGAYLAEDPGVAGHYKRILSDTVNVPDGTPLIEKRIAQMAVNFGGDDPISWLQKYKNGANHLTPALTKELVEQVTGKFRSGIFSPGGSLYELDIPDEAVARMLDWDAPLSRQAPIVRQHFDPIASPIRNEMAKPAPSGWGEFAAPQSYDPTGQELLGLLRDPNAQLSAQSFLANALGENVSRRLRDAGIPGLRFLDAGSRGAGGSGTRNIVVWDQDVLDEAARRGVKKK